MSRCKHAGRKRRMDLGLLQREVAKIIGVTESSVWNWEHGVEPEQHYNPKIIKFLGYIPFDCPDDTVGRPAWYKRAMGMNLDHLGEAMGRYNSSSSSIGQGLKSLLTFNFLVTNNPPSRLRLDVMTVP